MAHKEFDLNQEKLLNQRNELIQHYEENKIGTINFKAVPHAPHILSITLHNQEADEYLMLHSKEFAASTGSACNSSIIEMSHVYIELSSKPHKIFRISF